MLQQFCPKEKYTEFHKPRTILRKRASQFLLEHFDWTKVQGSGAHLREAVTRAGAVTVTWHRSTSKARVQTGVPWLHWAAVQGLPATKLRILEGFHHFTFLYILNDSVTKGGILFKQFPQSKSNIPTDLGADEKFPYQKNIGHKIEEVDFFRLQMASTS